MSQNFNKNTNFDKNLKLMSVSAAVLVALFVYTIYKSSTQFADTQYYIGLVFLFLLLIAAFGLRYYREKIRLFLEKKRMKTKGLTSF